MSTNKLCVTEVDDSIVERLLAHLRDGTTDQAPELYRVPRRNFTDPVVADAERRKIFGRVPFVAAHSSEVSTGGAPLARPLPRHDAALLRDDRDIVRAVTIDGAELPCQEHAGFVWVIDEVGVPIDVPAWLGPGFDDVLTSYRIDQLVCHRTGVFSEPANWKVMHDAFLDGYHIKYAHPNSAAKFVHTNVYAVEDFGSHARFGAPRKSLDGLIGQDRDGVAMSTHVTVSHFLGPNCTLLQHADHFQLLSFFPSREGAATSRMEMRLLVPRLADTHLDEAAWNAKWAKNWDILMQVLRDEDFPVLRAMQRALSSADWTEIVLGRNEVLNQAFHREIARALSG